MRQQLRARTGGIRRRIGLALDAFDTTYQATLVRSLKQGCAQRRLELLVFPGGILDSPERAVRLRHASYRLLEGGRLDGAIVLGSTMIGAAGPAGLTAFCEKLRPLPLCCIGARVPKVPSITVDNSSGIRKMVEHFVVQHGARRIAFLRGPVDSEEAEERFAAYREALLLHGIAPDAQLTPVGNFMPESGQAAVEQLLTAAEPPEAVIAANDYMAIGLLEGLANHPHRPLIPIGVAGFDNVEEANFSSPSLTTVEQPLQRIADAAIKCILDQLQGTSVQPEQRFETTEFIRQSCGCLSATAGPAETSATRSAADFQSEFDRRKAQIIAELSRAARGSLSGIGRWEEELLDALQAQLRGIAGSLFLSTLQKLLDKIGQANGEMWRFHAVLTELRGQILNCMSSDHHLLRKVEDIFQLSRLCIGDAMVRVQAQMRQASADLEWRLNTCATALAESADGAELARVLTTQLTRLGLSRSYIVLNQSTSSLSASAHVTLFHSLEASDIRAASMPYPSSQLLPDPLWGREPISNWVILPLFYRQHQLGFAMMDLVYGSGAPFETIRAQLSAAIYGAMMTAKSSDTAPSPALQSIT